MEEVYRRIYTMIKNRGEQENYSPVNATMSVEEARKERDALAAETSSLNKQIHETKEAIAKKELQIRLQIEYLNYFRQGIAEIKIGNSSKNKKVLNECKEKLKAILDDKLKNYTSADTENTLERMITKRKSNISKLKKKKVHLERKTRAQVRAQALSDKTNNELEKKTMKSELQLDLLQMKVGQMVADNRALQKRNDMDINLLTLQIKNIKENSSRVKNDFLEFT